MIRAFVRWLDGRTTEEDFDNDIDAIRWTYATPGIVSSAICERIPENSLMDDVDRAVWVCVDCIRPSEDRWRPSAEPKEETVASTSSKRKRKQR